MLWQWSQQLNTQKKKINGTDFWRWLVNQSNNLESVRQDSPPPLLSIYTRRTHVPTHRARQMRATFDQTNRAEPKWTKFPKTTEEIVRGEWNRTGERAEESLEFGYSLRAKLEFGRNRRAGFEIFTRLDLNLRRFFFIRKPSAIDACSRDRAI